MWCRDDNVEEMRWDIELEDKAERGERASTLCFGEMGGKWIWQKPRKRIKEAKIF